MSLRSPRIAGVLLSVLMLAASSACSSDPGADSPDTGENIDPGSDTGDPDAGDPDTGEPDATEPDTGEPDAGEPDAGEPDDHSLVLQGHLVPSGGTSMSSSFTLSGELAPNMPATTSSSANFVLEQSAPISTGEDGDE